MNTTKNPIALQSQGWLIQALLDLMTDRSYDKISVSEICRRAELDRRTFYRNFQSKNELLEQYIKILSNEYMTEFYKNSPMNRRAAAMLFFEYWKRHLPFIVNIQGCGLNNYVFTQFEKFVLINQKQLAGDHPANRATDYMLAYWIGGFWNVMLTWAAHGADVAPSELAAIIINS